VQSQEAKEFVSTVYKVLLGREPDQAGLEHWTNKLLQVGIGGFSQLLVEFSQSVEFQGRNALMSEKNTLETNRHFSFSSLDEEVLSRLFTKTSQYWRQSASDPEEIYWSVLSDTIYKGELDNHVRLKFLDSGKYDVDRVERIARWLGYDMASCRRFLDYGCGVGRLVFNLPQSIQEIHCVDFSEAHIQEAKKNLCSVKEGSRFSFHFIEELQDIRMLSGEIDLIHSFIVLQHNTPPIIQYTIEHLLGLLRPGGLAVLHIPTAKANYRFNLEDYLQSETSGTTMEMHILPKSNQYEAAKRSGCDIAFSFCDGGCGADIYSEIVVFRKQ